MRKETWLGMGLVIVKLGEVKRQRGQGLRRGRRDNYQSVDRLHLHHTIENTESSLFQRRLLFTVWQDICNSSTFIHRVGTGIVLGEMYRDRSIQPPIVIFI